jgi:hypothetical protein
MFFHRPKDSSFVFSVTEGTPSSRKQSGTGVLKKYKPILRLLILGRVIEPIYGD